MSQHFQLQTTKSPLDHQTIVALPTFAMMMPYLLLISVLPLVQAQLLVASNFSTLEKWAKVVEKGFFKRAQEKVQKKKPVRSTFLIFLYIYINKRILYMNDVNIPSTDPPPRISSERSEFVSEPPLGGGRTCRPRGAGGGRPVGGESQQHFLTFW